MQAGTAGTIDIDRTIGQSYIPFNTQMALKWNNCFLVCQYIGNYVGFWYKSHTCKKFHVYNTLSAGVEPHVPTA